MIHGALDGCVVAVSTACLISGSLWQLWPADSPVDYSEADGEIASLDGKPTHILMTTPDGWEFHPMEYFDE